MEYREYFWRLVISGDENLYESECSENTIYDVYEELLHLIFNDNIYKIFYNLNGSSRLDAPMYMLNIWYTGGEVIPMSINLSFRDTIDEYDVSLGDIFNSLKIDYHTMIALQKRRSYYYDHILPHSFQDIPWWDDN